ncbi:MAG: hypothetical protein ACJASU_001339 [Cognaticolwellia sp.]
MSEPCLAYIDHFIDIGTKKALVVLRAPTDILSKKGKTIQLKDCEYIGLKILEIINGESISLVLAQIFSQVTLMPSSRTVIIPSGKVSDYGQGNKRAM